MLLDDLVGVFRLHTLVEHAVRIDDGHRADGARAQAARLNDVDLRAEAVLCEPLLDGVAHLERARGHAPRAGAD